MQLVEREVPNSFNLFLFGDDHMGSAMRYDAGWDRMVDMVHGSYKGCKDNVCVDHGDIIEAITIDDKRFQMETTKEASILAQMKGAVRARRQIKSNLVTVIDGNHPFKLWRFGDITKWVCDELGVKFGSYQCKITYKFDDGSHFKHFAGHGWGSVKSAAKDVDQALANKRANLKMKLKRKAGDAIIMSMGHTHQLLCTRPEKELILIDDGKEIQQEYRELDVGLHGYIPPDQRYFFNTGSFTRLYADMGVSGYAERAGYDPVELGFYIVGIREKKIAFADKILL